MTWSKQPKRSPGSNARCQESSLTNTQVQLLQFLSYPNKVGWDQKANGTAQTAACWAPVRPETQWISPWRFQHVKRCRDIETFFAINGCFQPQLSIPFVPGTFHIAIVAFDVSCTGLEITSERYDELWFAVHSSYVERRCCAKGSDSFC